MKKVIKENYMFILIMILILAGAIFNIRKETDTSGIIVSTDLNNMECNNDILKGPKSSLRYMICDYGTKDFNSTRDRAEIYFFVQKNIDTKLVSRPDISSYFYKKIIKENPSDALSLFLQKEKVQKP